MICQSPQPGDYHDGPIDSPGRRHAIRQHGPTQVAKTTERAELAGNGPTYVSPDTHLHAELAGRVGYDGSIWPHQDGLKWLRPEVA